MTTMAVLKRIPKTMKRVRFCAIAFFKQQFALCKTNTYTIWTLIVEHRFYILRLF